MKCEHKNTYAVDTHDRIDCADCDETIIEGQQAIALRAENEKLRKALRHSQEWICQLYYPRPVNKDASYYQLIFGEGK